MSEDTTTTKKPLSKALKYLYGLGDGGFAANAMLLMQYFAPFLTNYAGFPLLLSGTIITVCNTIDMFAAPLSGVFIERSNMRWGKFRSWLFIGPIFIFVFNALQYSYIGPETVAALVIVIGSAVARTVWNVVFTSNMALVSKLTDDPDERTLLTARRSQYQYGFRLLFSLFGLAAIGFFISLTGSNSMGYTLMALLLGGVMLIGYWITVALTKGYDTQIKAGDSGVKQKNSFKDMIKVLISNPPLLALIVGDLFRNIGIFLLASYTFYYFTYVQGDTSLMTPYLTATSIVSFIGTLVAKPLITKMGTKRAFMSGPIVASVMLVVACFAASNGYIFIVCVCCSSIFTSLGQTVFMMLYNECAVYAEWKTGVDARGFIQGLCNLPIKIGSLVAGILLTAGLAAVNWSMGGEILAQTTSGINYLTCLLPVGAYVLAVISMLFFYKLTPQKLASMNTEIQSRKEQAALQD